MYAKLIDGCLYPAQKRETIDNCVVFNPTGEQLATLGYLPVVFIEQPDDPPSGYTYEFHWEEQDNEIVQTWELVELPDEISDEEAFAILMGVDE